MDIRNIKTPAPDLLGTGMYLEEMYQLQKDLIDKYIPIEGLPEYPLNIHSKKAQVVLKDMSARAIEEMAEGYESTHYVVNRLKKEGWNMDRLSPKDKQMVYNHLQNSNEEQADATAFYLELMIYAGIGPGDFFDYINSNDFYNDNYSDASGLLEELMLIGVMLLAKDNSLLLDTTLRYSLLDVEDFESKEKYEEVRGYIPAFTDLSDTHHELEPIMLWQVAYHLGVARNYLKNKPWKQSGELSDEQPFKNEVMKGFIKYMGYLHVMGFTPESLYNLFWRKHCVNEFRIRSGY